MGNEDQERKISVENKKDDKHPVPGEVNTGGGDFVTREKHVHGDEVHGDKVMGNKIVQEAPKPHIPLERPPRAAHFQDRKEALTKLIADLHPGQVVTLCGPGGIGKSALAAEAVWQLAPGTESAARFPDGILFHSFYNQPQVALALEHIARSFGEEAKPTPKEAAQRALAGRRALLILDGTEQTDDLREVVDIRDQCGVLITSRSRQDAVNNRLDVAPLPLTDAVALLQAWGGSRATDTIVVHQIVELVGRLPLALRLVGRYLTQSEEDASEYLTWLAETPLTALAQGQRREQSIPLLLERSLAQISESARRVLGMVGLLALAPFPRDPIAAALKLSAGDSRQAFGELVNYGLLLRLTENYEVSHALIHTYTRLQLAPAIEIINQLVAYYVQFVDTHQTEFEQLNRVRPHIMVLLRNCHAREAWAAAHDLAWKIADYLDLQGYWIDRITALEIGLAAARALHNRQKESTWLGSLGQAYCEQEQIEQAITYYEQALMIAQAIGDRGSESSHLGSLGSAYRDQGQIEQAIAYYEQALMIAQTIGDRRNESSHLGSLGSAYRDQGQIEQAITYYEQALMIAQAIGDRRNEGIRLGSLGLAYHKQGQIEQAITYYEQALTIAQAIGDRQNEAIPLCNLGRAYRDLGELTRARNYVERSLSIFEEIKLPIATTVRKWLESLKNK